MRLGKLLSHLRVTPKLLPGHIIGVALALFAAKREELSSRPVRQIHESLENDFLAKLLAGAWLSIFHLLGELLDLTRDELKMAKHGVFGLSILVCSLVRGAFAAQFGEEESRSVAEKLWLEEYALHHANLVDELALVILAAECRDVALNRAHNSKQQVHEDDRVEDDAEEEEEHLRVAKALCVIQLETDDSADKDLSPNLHILTQPLILPVPDGVHFQVLIVRWLDPVASTQICRLLVQDLSDRLEHVREAENADDYHAHV